MRSQRLRHPAFLLTVTTLVLLVGELLCCRSSPASANEGDPYLAHHSMQTFERDGEQVRALRIPVYLTLRSWQERQLGLRLRLAASFSAADVFEILEESEFDRIEVMSFVPGLEFIVPLGRHSMLRPYVDAGLGVDDATDNLHFLGALGLRTEFIFLRGRHLFGLEPGMQISLNSGPELRSRSVFNGFLSVTARRILGFQLAGYPPDAGVYFDAGYNFQTLEYTSLTASGEVGTNLELGIDFGFSQGRPKIGPVRIPRIRVGYRFGDLEGFRIRLGGDWLTTVSE